MTSLADAAERKILETLTEQIKSLSEESVYAVGGSIPITSLGKHLICETDGSVSGTEHSTSASNASDSDVRSDQGNDNSISKKDDGELEPDDSGDDTASEVKHPEKNETSDEEVAEDTSDNESSADENVNDDHAMRCDPVTIRWDSMSQCSKLTLPIHAEERPSLDQLLRDCQPASFGLDGIDVMDETYRKAGKLDETAFCTNFNPYALNIVDTVMRALAPDHWLKSPKFGIRAELYKLNVYSAPSGMFKSHVDTPRSRHQLGSLVVCLPCIHEGGQLVVRHEGRETVFDWSGEQGANAIQWAAFYGDCEHEVLEVTDGHRLTLTYNLYVTCPMNKASIDPKKLEVFDTLKTVLQQPQFCKKGVVLGYNCVHSYPHETDRVGKAFPSIFKGADKLVFECFESMDMKTKVRACIQSKDYSEGFESDEEAPSWLDDWEKPKNPHPLQNPDSIGDKAYLATGIPEFSLQSYGFEESSYLPGLLEEWDSHYTRQNVLWLNEPTEKRLALVHPTVRGPTYLRICVKADIISMGINHPLELCTQDW